MQKIFVCFLILVCMNVNAEMKALDDEVLSGVSGQSGLTLDLEANVSIGELAYFDDGQGIALQGLRLSSAVDPDQFAEYRFELDVLNSGDISLSFKSENLARFEVEEIRFVDSAGVLPVTADPSIGGIFIDYEIEGSLLSYNRGNSFIGPNNILGGLYDLDFTISNGRFGYRTNGNEFLLDGLTLDVSSLGMVFGVNPAGELNILMPNLLAELSVEAIRFSSNPLNHGVSNDVSTGNPLASYGSLWVDMDLSTDTRIKAGGAQGLTGMTINSNTIINRMDIAWGDDTDWNRTGYWVGALGISGSLNLLNLTVDILDDSDLDPAKNFGTGLGLAFEQLEANLRIEDFVLGETKQRIDTYNPVSNAPIQSIGSIDLNVLFADGMYNATALENRVLLQAGGNSDAGYQGIRLDTQLSIISPNNESNFVYTDDNLSLMMSGFEAFVDGDVTLDITKSGQINGRDFYDGLRVGFEDLAFGYRFEGFRVAEDSGDINDLKGKDLQSAQGIEAFSGMLGLGGQASLEGVIDGQVTLGPGGNEGVEGITINADISISDGQMAKFIEADGSGKGLWLSGLNYDVHLRDMKLDVAAEGLKIYESESWSKLDVTDFKVGGKLTGASFGRVVLESYEVASETTISAGGAGAVCIGGVGSSRNDCQNDNGRWDDRGNQGITVATKRHFKDKIEAEGKRNRFTWEVARFGEGTSAVTNGSGLQLIFDNFTTNDGDGLTDTFGIQSTHSLDVARTRVIKKTTGIDSNGIFGNAGDEKIMRADGSYEYKSASSLTGADRNNRPVGVALRNNTQFKELDFERVNLSHPVGGESTLLYGLKLQNFNITTDITATPMD